MVLGISVLILAAATASNPREVVSIRCAMAVARVVAYRRSMNQAVGEQEAASGDTADPDDARCVQSRKDPGRTFVSMPSARPLVYEHGPAYAVDASGDIRVLRDIPCDEAEPHVCE
ncbi:hypothetical protein [Tahibacter sp.]|uniref:hypothetical protein n=1 Tax=Tahibacter sp. TaxID=2056211 RepID=UPI0028C3C629|nr:hypothetical protein [Tahibacter sp.]